MDRGSQPAGSPQGAEEEAGAGSPALVTNTRCTLTHPPRGTLQTGGGGFLFIFFLILNDFEEKLGEAKILLKTRL